MTWVNDSSHEFGASDSTRVMLTKMVTRLGSSFSQNDSTRVTVNDSRLESVSFSQNLWVLDGQTHFVCTRDDHYPVCRLDIRQDSEFATGYGDLKTAFKRKPDTDPDIRNAFVDISRIQTFGNSCTLHNHSISEIAHSPQRSLRSCNTFSKVAEVYSSVEQIGYFRNPNPVQNFLWVIRSDPNPVDLSKYLIQSGLYPKNPLIKHITAVISAVWISISDPVEFVKNPVQPASSSGVQNPVGSRSGSRIMFNTGAQEPECRGRLLPESQRFSKIGVEPELIFFKEGPDRSGAGVSFLIRGYLVYCWLLLLQIVFYKACSNVTFKFAILLHRKS